MGVRVCVLPPRISGREEVWADAWSSVPARGIWYLLVRDPRPGFSRRTPGRPAHVAADRGGHVPLTRQADRTPASTARSNPGSQTMRGRQREPQRSTRPSFSFFACYCSSRMDVDGGLAWDQFAVVGVYRDRSDRMQRLSDETRASTRGRKLRTAHWRCGMVCPTTGSTHHRTHDRTSRWAEVCRRRPAAPTFSHDRGGGGLGGTGPRPSVILQCPTHEIWLCTK